MLFTHVEQDQAGMKRMALATAP